MECIALLMYIRARFNQKSMKLQQIAKRMEIISFLKAYITVWENVCDNEAITEYYGGTLTKVLQSYCLANGLPHTMSADDLLSDIQANLIQIP